MQREYILQCNNWIKLCKKRCTQLKQTVNVWNCNDIAKWLQCT